MPARVMISGSVAYDTIMVFEGQFKDHILPDRVHMINVSFFAPTLKREFGGCAANIAYNLKGLGGEPVVLAAVGRDGQDYMDRFASLGIDHSRVLQVDGHYTAQAFITTDLSDNQISAFHPGAMARAHEVSASGDQTVTWGIVAPNSKEAMLRHAAEFADQSCSWIFDPGQQLPAFDGPELRDLIGRASAVAVNDYECQLLCERTGWSEADMAARVGALIVTRGAQGSWVYVGAQRHELAPVKAGRALDPTGCGDAYRGGLLYGLTHGMDWVAAARLGSVMGALKIEHAGAQNHRIDRAEVASRYRETYGSSPW